METRKQSQSTKKKVFVSNLTDKIKKNKKNRRIKYDQLDIENALKAMKDTGLSLRKAAAAFGVPVATLGRKKNIGPDKIKKRSGPETVLSSEEEHDIVKWVLDRASMGAPVTKTELLDCVQKYVQKLGIKTSFSNDRPGRHWYEGFRRRHPELSIRKPQHLSLSRAAVSREELQEWFKNSGEYLESKNLSNISPTRIFNCDESSLLLCPDAERVLAEKGSRAVYKVVDGGKEALTVLFMYRADGVRAPPMLMYSFKKTVPKKIVDNTPTGWGIGVSDNGWMTTETFYEYITNVFYPWLVEQKTEFPVILYMDNHSSHLNLPLVTFCREKQIELVMLPPNSTHIMQPLDISFFRPFKDVWKKCVPKWKNQEDVAQIKKENFPLVLKFTLDNMKNESNVVVSGFKGSGLYPFDSKAVDYDILQKGKTSKQTIHREEINNSHSDYDEDQQFLQKFEKNLPADTLYEFQNAAISGSWIGDLEKKGLFKYWLTISKNTTGNTLKQKPIMENFENVNHYSQNDAEKNLNADQPHSSSDINADTNFSINDLFTNDQELSTHIDIIDSINTEQVLLPVIIIPDNDNNAVNCEQHTPLDYDRNILEFMPELDQVSHQEPSIDCNNDSQDTLIDLNKHNSVDQTISLNKDLIVSLQHDEIGTQPTFISPAFTESHQTDIIGENNNNELPSITVDKDILPKRPLKEIFTLPLEYLPKKKRVRIEKSGKSKLPSVGTSDAWYQHQLEKENLKKIKEEKQKNKKRLQEEKKKLMDKVKELQKKIKEEK